MSLKANNLTIGQSGYSWEDLYNIDADNLTNATRDNFKVLPLGDIAVCFYTGTGALTLSDFANLPNGSIIFATNLTAAALYVKKAAAGTATFKYVAINT